MTSTSYKTKTGARALILSLALAFTTFGFSPVFAQQAVSPAFQVKTTSDGSIRAGVRAYKKGKYEKAVTYHLAALKAGLSPKRAGIAHSNLCAAYGELGQMEAAKTACATALELRPEYALALANKTALGVKLAQN